MGVRNRHVYICSQNDNKDSQSIENDIILEGFQQAEEKHGLRHIRVVGDGDL